MTQSPLDQAKITIKSLAQEIAVLGEQLKFYKRRLAGVGKDALHVPTIETDPRPIPSPPVQPNFRQAAQIVRQRGAEFEQELTMLISAFTALEGAIIWHIDVKYELRRKYNMFTRQWETFCEYTIHPLYRIREERT
jgi:hypothetical protein